MKLSRLFQPRNPVFWMMLGLNALSMALGWLVQNRPLNTLGLLVVGVFGVANAVLGMWLAWQLVRDPPGAKRAPPAPTPASPPSPE
jgi:uncharacterized membrane protein HdeD (DUF308 family)